MTSVDYRAETLESAIRALQETIRELTAERDKTDQEDTAKVSKISVELRSSLVAIQSIRRFMGEMYW